MRSIPLALHLGLLVCFAAFMLLLWMLPVLLVGFPFALPDIVPIARSFGETGAISSLSVRLSVLFVWGLHPLLTWQNATGWSAVSAMGLAAALLPWWWSMYRLFDARIAWVSTVILGLMPIYWIEALRLTGYSFGLFGLFLGAALFLELHPRRKLLAAIAFGLCFGLALGSRDAFVTFLPWLAGAYLWLERARWKQALLAVTLSCAIAYIAFTLPLLFEARRAESPAHARLIEVLIPFGRTDPGVEHLYPDDYTYQFDKEEFDATVLEGMEDASFLKRRQMAKILHHFHLSDGNVFDYLGQSAWMFVNAMVTLFVQETLGGAFLWVFILPGILVLYRQRPRLLALLLGLWLSTEFILRFLLHFGRHHLEDIGWMAAIFAAVGVVAIASVLQTQWKRSSVTALSFVVVLLIAVQLVQTNRKQFARLYERSEVPAAFAAAEALEKIPADAVVAHPRKHYLFSFSDRSGVSIHQDTVDRYAAKGSVAAPFTHYGVTHIMGYDDAQTQRITSDVRGMKVIAVPKPVASVPLTPFMKYLLHVVR